MVKVSEERAKMPDSDNDNLGLKADAMVHHRIKSLEAEVRRLVTKLEPRLPT